MDGSTHARSATITSLHSAVNNMLINGSAPNIPLADNSVQCVITSPPYWGLRDYGVNGQLGLERASDCLGWATGNPCGECYVCHMVQVFREVRRVLKPNGTLWLNLGDSYAGSGQGWRKGDSSIKRRWLDDWDYKRPPGYISSRRSNGLKPKDLVGIPWRVALALQADGWWLRQDIIWAKGTSGAIRHGNAMPESVKDRCTKAHEHVFLLTKSRRYYFNYEAIKERSVSHATRTATMFRRDHSKRSIASVPGNTATHRPDRPPVKYNGQYSNRRDVWVVSPASYTGAHFATFPPDLVEPMVLAGSSVGDIVLDPFAGTATVGEVCIKHNRRFAGIELNREYIKLAQERLYGVQIAMPIF